MRSTYRSLLVCVCILVSSIVNAQPPNDDCANATALTLGTNASSTVRLSTNSGIATACSGTPDDDVWFSFSPTTTSVIVTLPSIGGGLNTSGLMVELFSGSCGSLVSLQCNTASTGFTATGLTAGATYYLRCYSAGNGWTGNGGNSAFSINVATPPPPPAAPTNDEPANAIIIPTAGTCYNSKGTVANATASASIPIGSCTGTPDDDVWFKFTAAKSNPTISLSTVGTNLSTSGARLQLLSGSPGSFASLACGTTSITASGLSVGEVYYVRVYSAGSTTLTSTATFNICVTDPGSSLVTDSTTTLFNMDTVAKQLGFPWEIHYGPDDSLWITEARGYRVVRMSASRTEAQKNIAPQQVLKIPLGSSLVSFSRSIGGWPQGGMEGLAIHPEFANDTAKQFVYIAYVYSGTCPSNPASPCYFRSKIVRCQFYYANHSNNPYPGRDTLVIKDTVISNLPGSNDHNSGRLKISPVAEGGSYKLYYTIGDMGAGQFNNASRPMHAQNRDTCEGKILRLNAEPDTDGDPSSWSHDFERFRKWIPNDNPYNHSLFTTLKTPIYSYGHRNAQGLAFGNVNGTWRLYSSEHGDKSDDELNLITSGGNYGWPLVAGKIDDNYTTSDNTPNGFTSNDALAGQSVAYESSAVGTTEPMFSFFNWSGAQLETISGNLFTWPTIAPSGLEFYGSSQIPGWKNSLLVGSLKYGMFRLKLKSDGLSIDSSLCVNVVDTFPILHGWRVRDLAISPNGGYIWAVIDSTGSTSGPTGGFGGSSSNTRDGGKVIRLSYKWFVTLPVNILTFNGRLTPDNNVLLNWQAVMNDQHHYFEVEKSLNGTTFTPIGRLYGAQFTLTDPNPVPGNNYYRLKAVDHDGRFAYSKIINVQYDPAKYIVAVFPNPVKENLSIRIGTQRADKIQLYVTDMQGRVVYNENRMVSAGRTDININARTWASQVYTVVVKDANGNIVMSQKVMKL